MSSTGLSPCRTVVTSFTPRLSKTADSIETDEYEEGVWVLYVAASNTSPKSVSCALSNGEICTYDQDRLHQIHSIPKAHGDAMITDLTVGGKSENVLASSGKDGRICLFDIRQPTSALQCQLPRAEEALSLSIGYDGALAAVGGSKAKVHFFDLRQGGNILGSYVDSHTEEVTRVRFQPNPENDRATTPLLVSASEDGLACVYDTSQPSEEAALKSVLNVQTPLREVGFFGPSYEGLYCLTGSETMSVWHHDSAQRICDFGMNIRSKLSYAAGGIDIDYLVNCEWDPKLNKLSLLAGNSCGGAALYKVDAGVIALEHMLRGGHRGCVRSWCRLSTKRFLTGGEDARLCEWNRMGLEEQAGISNRVSNKRATDMLPPEGGGPVRRAKKKATMSPY